jgi:CheY-like chemotaxis protein
MSKDHYTVLLVDDSADDRMILHHALEGHPKLLVVGQARDGDEAISYLSGDLAFADRAKFPFPDLMLLDLKMPKKTGYEVLEWLRLQPFNHLPVFVISGSLLAEDRERSLKLGALGFHRKPALKVEQDAMFRDIEVALENIHRGFPA